MIPTYKINPTKITLQDCPLEIYYQGHRINGKFTFEELSGFYHNVKKYHLFLGDTYKVYLYQLTGKKEGNIFSLFLLHHQDIWEDPDYLYAFSIPQGLELSHCLIPGQTWYRIDHWDRLFQIVPSVIKQPNISDARD